MNKLSRLIKWAIHGPVVDTRVVSVAPIGDDDLNIARAVYRQHADGTIYFVASDGSAVNITRQLYERGRLWQLLGTRYGENGTVSPLENRTYYEAIDEVKRLGSITKIDVLSGTIAYRRNE